jgi:hypothetical protein
MLHGPPLRASCIGISQQWRASLTDGNSVIPAQVTSIKVKEESVDLTALAGDRKSILVAVCFARATNSAQLPRAECLLGFPEREMSAVGTKPTKLDEPHDVSY